MTTVHGSPVRIAGQLKSLAIKGIALGSLLGVPSAFQMLFAEPAVSTVPLLSTAAIARSSDGLFHVKIGLRGRNLDCVIDTGATSLVLPERSISDLGIGVMGPRGQGRLITAGGTVAASRVHLDNVSFGGRNFDDVAAVVAKGAAPCLIGQELLARLDTVSLHGSMIQLR